MAAGISTTIKNPRAIIWNLAPAPRLRAGYKSSRLRSRGSQQVNERAASSSHQDRRSRAETTRELPTAGLNKNSIVLQVAAVKLQRDALEMADAIQQKKFPSFVATSPADNFYHVQVGPYPDMASAENAKRALEQLGFKPIIKH